MPELKTIRDRLVNWSRWSRGGPAKSQHSMTGFICDRMRIAAVGELHTSGGGGDRLDSVDATLVERAWKGLPPKHRELLRWHYIHGASPGFICRRMGIKPRPASIFDVDLAQAEVEIQRALLALAERGPNYRASTRAVA